MRVTWQGLSPAAVALTLALAGWRGAPAFAGNADAAIAAALAKVSAQSPREYPEIVTPLPEAAAMADMPTARVLALLGYWNPAMRSRAAAELGQRGDDVIPLLRQALASESPERRAGALDAFHRMIRHRARHWQEFRPEETNHRVAQDSIRREFADLLLDPVLGLTRDPEWRVRREALSVIGELGVRNRQVSLAVLERSVDEDEYIADFASRVLHRNVGLSDLEPEVVLPFLRQAFQNPLPRGKGHLMALIAESGTSFHRALIPEMLAHLDWQPDRDTMFGAGGQAEAVRLLTELRVEELVPRLPALMDKPMRGPGLFDPSVASIQAFGPEARPILPDLRERIAGKEAELEALAGRDDRRSRQRAEQLQNRLEALGKAVSHVEP